MSPRACSGRLLVTVTWFCVLPDARSKARYIVVKQSYRDFEVSKSRDDSSTAAVHLMQRIEWRLFVVVVFARAVKDFLKRIKDTLNKSVTAQ